jgi:uncharacterized membrane protein YkoI
MPVFPRLSLLLIGLVAGSAQAADPVHVCLTEGEQRAAVANHRALPLAAVIKSVNRHRTKREAVRVRLCRRGERLVYELTLLTPNGKVIRRTVDAANGKRIKSR